MWHEGKLRENLSLHGVPHGSMSAWRHKVIQCLCIVLDGLVTLGRTRPSVIVVVVDNTVNHAWR